jgi:Ca2+-binding RTX toxin-like protein
VPAFHLNTNTVVAATTVINTVAAGGYGYLVDQGPTGPDFTNLGNITFTRAPGQTGVVALQLASGSGIDWLGHTVDNEGHITVASSGTGVFLASDSSPTIINGGTISVTGSGDAEGIRVSDKAGVQIGAIAADITNSGQLLVSGDGVVNGVYVGDGGVVTNSGLISVTGTGANSVVHGIWSPFAVVVQNNGQIVATDSNPDVQCIAIQFGGGPNTIINNHGTITGDIAIEDTNTTNSDSQFASVDNYGTINGRIIMGIGSFGLPNNIRTVANSGTINGDVDMGPGDDRFFGQTGVQNGLVSGGLGNDVIYGGASRDSLQGNQGNDTLYGGAGDDIVVGGKDDDQQFGEDGNDVVWGNLGNDTLNGGDGADQVRGGQGDDSVSGGAGDDFLSGDRGNDTITGGAGADLFHGSQDAGVDRVLDFNLGEGDRVMLDPGTTYTVSQVGADTVIDMGAGNTMILVGVQMSTLMSGWIFPG